MSFIQRFGSRFNLHIHFHCVDLDGVFYSDDNGTLQFSDVYYLGKEDSDQVEARVRKRVLSLFKRREILTEQQFEELKSWKGNGGFSVNADVAIEESNRRGAERLIRYCVRSAFSGEKLTLISEKASYFEKRVFEFPI